jgi:hypothetical protein
MKPNKNSHWDLQIRKLAAKPANNFERKRAEKSRSIAQWNATFVPEKLVARITY